ncbi:hypothetical protein ABZ990_25780 [Streptomyces sp. NPDC046203]|uniref:DUF7144 family membrane protein n=1 Tax=Streptomyces sp. NPDC046203 TaxID=3154602 RepID=UPI0033D9D815
MAAMPSGARQDAGGSRDAVQPTKPALFAGVALFISGVLSFLLGVAGIAQDRLFLRPGHYEYRFDLTAWGWIHLIIGVVLLIVAVGVLMMKGWARGAGIGLAAISLVTQFMFIPYYPAWAITVMVLDLVIIWGLARLLD